MRIGDRHKLAGTVVRLDIVLIIRQIEVAVWTGILEQLIARARIALVRLAVRREGDDVSVVPVSEDLGDGPLSIQRALYRQAHGIRTVRYGAGAIGVRRRGGLKSRNAILYLRPPGGAGG